MQCSTGTTVISLTKATQYLSLQLLSRQHECINKITSKFRLLSTATKSKPRKTTLNESPIDVVKNVTDNKSFALVLQKYFTNETPLLIKGYYSKSKACKKWNNIQYLKQLIGANTLCDVELGAKYNDPKYQRPAINFGDYCDYLEMFETQFPPSSNTLPDRKEMLYLAQNELFPSMRKDFIIPQFCSDPSYGVGIGSIYSSMLWLGPRGTVSPLHYDPLNNLFIQFAGTKKVWLYPPTNPDCSIYYAGSSSISNNDEQNAEQYNTSSIDIENPDLDKYPMFQLSPKAFVAELEPGDVLFIPSKWWHYVRSLSQSVSVNQWWR